MKNEIMPEGEIGIENGVMHQYGLGAEESGRVESVVRVTGKCSNGVNYEITKSDVDNNYYLEIEPGCDRDKCKYPGGLGKCPFQNEKKEIQQTERDDALGSEESDGYRNLHY